jgi:hypothetical protein
MPRVRWHNHVLERLLGWLAVLTLALFALLLGNPSFSNASRPPRGLHDPVLALQLARNVEDVDAILGDSPSPDREAMRFKQYLDFGFIACYAALYLLLSFLLAQSYPWGRVPAIAAAVCVLAAAGFDVAENFAILRVCDLPLRQTTQTMIDAIRLPSLAKYGLATLATGLLTPYFLASSRRGMRAVGALNLLAVLLGLFGFVNHNFFSYAGIPLLAGLLGIAGMFFRPGLS